MSREPVKATLSVNGGPEVDLESPEAEAEIRKIFAGRPKDFDDMDFNLAVGYMLTKPKGLTVSFIQRQCGWNYNKSREVIDFAMVKGILSRDNDKQVWNLTENGVRLAQICARVLQISVSTGVGVGTIVETAINRLGQSDSIPAQTEKPAPQESKPPRGSRETEGRNETTDSGGVSGQRLKAFVERVERLEEEKAGLAEDIKDIYAEAKGVGFDTKTIRKIIRLRAMDKEKRREEDEILELYKSTLGMD